MKKFKNWNQGFCLKKNYKQAESFAKELENRAIEVNFRGEFFNWAWYVRIKENNILYTITWDAINKEFEALPTSNNNN